MPVKIVLIGASGYAGTYLEPLLRGGKDDYEFAGIVDINFPASPYYQKLIDSKIPMFSSLESYFEKHTADLVIVSIPTHFHKYYSILAVQNGANVLCEKPVAPLYSDGLEMLKAAEQAGKFIAVSYQWSFADAFLNLKRDILDGVFGRPKLLKAFVSRPRTWDYYARGSGWAGKIKDDKGNMILDSVLSNSTAHYLHNMYFMLGERLDTSAMPKTIGSLLYRANDIENFDTCALDIQTENGGRIFYVATHASEQAEGPIFDYEFEHAHITYGVDGQTHITARFNDGTIRNYGNPNSEDLKRLWVCVKSAKTGSPLTCTVETAMPLTYTVDRLYREGTIYSFPAEYVRKDAEKHLTTIDGLHAQLKEAYHYCDLALLKI